MAAQSGNIFTGSFTGMGVAGIDATIGWWVSWLIGPGRLPLTGSEGSLPKVIFRIIMYVMAIGACFGALGAAVTKIIQSIL
jgi:hypothetical protein